MIDLTKTDRDAIIDALGCRRRYLIDLRPGAFDPDVGEWIETELEKTNIAYDKMIGVDTEIWA